MPALSTDGRIGECEIFIGLPIMFAWGRGNPDWDATPEPEPTSATALVDEVGRRRATQAQFVVPDPDGQIEMPNGQRYNPSQVPTAYAHVRCVFNFNEAKDETIREVAVFFNSQPVAGLPPGQLYFTPGQIATPGRMKLLDRLQTKIVRDQNVKQTFEYVLPF